MRRHDPREPGVTAGTPKPCGMPESVLLAVSLVGERLVAVRDGLHDRSVGGLLTAGSFADPFAFDRESVPIRPGLVLCAQGVIDGLPEAGVDLRQFAATDRAQIELRGKGRRTGPVSAGVRSTGPIARDPAPGTVNRKPIDAFGPGGQVGQMTSHPRIRLNGIWRDFMQSFRRAFAGLCLAASGIVAQAQPVLPAAEPVYPVAVESAIVYGQGQVGAPAPGSKNLLLDLYRPVGAEAAGERSPALVIIHGGGFTGGSRTQAELVTIARALAARGFVAVSIDYRLAPDAPVPSTRVASILGPATAGTSGADLAQRTAAVAAIDDGLTAVDWLQANANRFNIDPAQIGLLGGSAGAITAVHLGYILDDYGIAANPFSFVVDLWGAFGLTGSVPIVRLLPDVVCQAIADGDLQIPTLPTSAGAAE